MNRPASQNIGDIMYNGVIFERNDGWDNKAIDEYFSDCFDRMKKLMYEVEFGRRDSYAKIGSTTSELLYEIISIGEDMVNIANDLLE